MVFDRRTFLTRTGLTGAAAAAAAGLGMNSPAQAQSSLSSFPGGGPSSNVSSHADGDHTARTMPLLCPGFNGV